MTIDKSTFSRRTLLRGSAGIAGILATGRAPAFAQAQPKKLVFAHIRDPESAAVAFDWMAKAVTERSKGALDVQFFGRTLIPQGAGDHERREVRHRSRSAVRPARPRPCSPRWARSSCPIW